MTLLLTNTKSPNTKLFIINIILLGQKRDDAINVTLGIYSCAVLPDQQQQRSKYLQRDYSEGKARG